MKVVKKFLLVILLIVALGSGVYWAQTQGYFENSPLANISIPEINLPSQITDKVKLPEKLSPSDNDTQKIKDLAQDATEQTKELSSKALVVGDQAQKILGESVKAGEEKPIHESALEYGKYIYCKEVVKAYEEGN